LSAFTLLVSVPASFAADPVANPTLQAAALEFAIPPRSGGPTVGKPGASVRNVAGPLTTTLASLADGAKPLCLVTTHFNTPKAGNVRPMFRRAVAGELGLPVSNVLIFVSHNHTGLKMAENQVEAYDA